MLASAMFIGIEAMMALTEESGIDRPICLVVDDEDGIRHFVSHALGRLGIAARGCRDAKDMLDGLPHHASGLIFLDLSLQDSDAVEAIKGLDERRFRGAVQLISGRGAGLLNEIKRIGERHGLRMLPPLEKPFGSAAIESAARREGLFGRREEVQPAAADGGPGAPAREAAGRSLAASLGRIEAVLAEGSSHARRDALRRITDLFVENAAACHERAVENLDRVFLALIETIEAEACAELSERLARVPNAPLGTVRRLADDDEIAVAGPVLRFSPRLGDADLRRIAETKSQAHLLAIGARDRLAPSVTTVLVRRGGPDVLHAVAGNPGSRFSGASYRLLIDRSAGDDALQERIGQRADLPPDLLDRLTRQAGEAVRRRLGDVLGLAYAVEIDGAVDAAAETARHAPGLAVRDYTAAQRDVAALERSGQADEVALAGFARQRRFEETALVLSRLCDLPLQTSEALMAGPRIEPLLVLCRASAFAHSTAEAVLQCSEPGRRLDPDRLREQLDIAERCSVATAQRIMRFWRIREAALRQH